jgi:hypothetical protein
MLYALPNPDSFHYSKTFGEESPQIIKLGIIYGTNHNLLASIHPPPPRKKKKLETPALCT